MFSSGNNSCRISVIVISEDDAWFSPLDGSFLSVLVSNGELLLTSEPRFPIGKVLPVDVVEDGI